MDIICKGQGYPGSRRSENEDIDGLPSSQLAVNAAKQMQLFKSGFELPEREGAPEGEGEIRCRGYPSQVSRRGD